MSPVAAGDGADAPARVLVVDDNEVNRDLLSRRVRRLGHDADVAVDGRDALGRLAAEPYDLVLLDIMMPEVNGYEVLERLKADGALRHVPVIMISAVDDMASIIRCIELGAEDYLPKPFDPVLLKARVGASLARKRLHDREARYLRSMERELEIGREIQRGFLPASLPRPDGWEVAAVFRPARQVAGDFYDMFELPCGSVMLVVADVCDKGVGAALFMALFRSLFRAVATEEPRATPADEAAGTDDALAPAEARLRRAIRVTNDYIARTHGAANMFATFFAAVLDPATGELRYVNGGHEPPAVLGPAGARTRLAPTGPAVGMLPDLEFGVGRERLAPGETLVAFTDGVTEARDAAGTFLAASALDTLLAPAPSAAALLDRASALVAAHAGDGELWDDVTMLAVRREEAEDGRRGT